MGKHLSPIAKYCTRCDKETPHGPRVSGVARCIPCNNDWGRRFRTSRALYAELFAKQHGCCAVCGFTSSDLLHLDHDHATDRHRELLCRDCNLLIGWSHDSIARLEAAIAYLKRNASN